jgi:hypothetical protein
MMLPLENQLKQRIHSCHSGSKSSHGDRDVGCFLQFFEVVMADWTGLAAPWDTCSKTGQRLVDWLGRRGPRRQPPRNGRAKSCW